MNQKTTLRGGFLLVLTNSCAHGGFFLRYRTLTGAGAGVIMNTVFYLASSHYG